MLCTPQVSDKRLTSHMQCKGLVRDTDNRFSEDQLVHCPVYVFPENRDNKFTVFSRGHSSDWRLAQFSSSIQEINRTSYLTSGIAATEGFELIHWLDQLNEKNMQDRDIFFKPLPNGGTTLGQQRHRKKVKNSLTTCPTCHVVANTSSGLVTAPLISYSDTLHDDAKPPKRSSKKRRNKSKHCRQATCENHNLLPELLCEEQIDAASPLEVLLPDLLAEKLSDTSSSASLLVKDTHMGKDNAESSNGYVEHRTIQTLSTVESDGKDGPGSTGSSNITVGERVSCEGAPYLNVGERVQCSSEACSSKLFLPVSSERSGRRSRKTSSYNTNRVVGSNRHIHSGKDNPVSVWQKVEKLNAEKSYGAGHENKNAQEDTNRSMDKHRCRKSCKHHSPDVPVEMELTTENSALNYCRKFSRCMYKKQAPFLYAPKNCIPKMPKNHSEQIEGLSMLQQLVCAHNLDSHLVPQSTSKEACTLVIQDDAHSPCHENKAILTDLDSMNSCAEEPKDVKSFSASAHMPHKWVPIVKRDKIHFDLPEVSVVEVSVPANDVSVYANIDVQRNVSDVPASTKREGSEVATEVPAKLNSSGQPDLECHGHIETVTAFSKITEAVSDAYRAQQRAEDIQLLVGRPLADFEQFIYSASPVLHCTPCLTGCNSSSQECITDRSCFHQTADISLSSIWQWYEEPGCYGLEVKAQDLRRSKGFWNSHYQFNAYFVPYLSAVQLFGQPKRTIGKDAADTGGARSKTSSCLSSLPILAKLLPQESNQRNSPSALHIKDDQQLETIEPIFEFFESEQPFWRRQLFNKVKELIDGAKQSNCQISGDPKNLELNLHDLHPASWYCVAWYPIYRIPDGKFQAAFLTYHSLGHWVHRRSSSDQAGHGHVVLPVMGLQSYNDKGEWWFQTSRSTSEDINSTDSSCSQVSQVLRERVSTLKQAAAAMARADMPSKDRMRSRNRHPDYEFFLSWCR
ncbi:uncharacterized protein LOC124702393 isoform X1 [Lolium rigidum]|uniref:uncharacterized protein LOC124702393 isoform X1 n=1 Tax=Lolium rigidum TaxID=89674 RepID=UPI001F5E1095|nr:uncharacterized protein LOC124702393 isoform X1 [Lolium rigidum]